MPTLDWIGITTTAPSDVSALGDAEPQNSSRDATHNIHTRTANLGEIRHRQKCTYWDARSYHTHRVWTHSVQQPMMKRAIHPRSASPVWEKAASIAR